MASARQKRKVKKVMAEHKHGTLRSGSGKKVKSRKQAIAIAMSESGQSRAKKSSHRCVSEVSQSGTAPIGAVRTYLWGGCPRLTR